jgi:hypothetical protein
MDKPTEAEALRDEYLDLWKIMYDTCLTGIKKVEAHMVGSMLECIVTQSALLAALLFLEVRGIVVIFIAVVLLTFWWFNKSQKEWAKHEEVDGTYKEMEQRLKSIEREYLALTGTDIRQTFTEIEMHKAYEQLLKERGQKYGITM